MKDSFEIRNQNSSRGTLTLFNYVNMFICMRWRGTTLGIISLAQNWLSHFLNLGPTDSIHLIRCGFNAVSADSIHLIRCGLNAVSADSIHLIGCGYNAAISAETIHLIGCGLNAVSADSIHLICFHFSDISFLLCLLCLLCCINK